MKLALGTVVTPNIKLIRAIDRGSSKSVWLAHHRGLGRPVAVEFFTDARSRGPEALQRFQRRVESVMQIRSPYTVRLMEHGTAEDGTPYLVMEQLDGETLEARLERQGMLTLQDAGVVLRQVGSALDAAHARGIVHGDIRPARLFVIGDRSRVAMVKVLDFGEVREERRAAGTAPNTAEAGASDYASPEQLLGAKDDDFRSDLWALAVVTYRMVTGELPFRAPTSHALFYAICKGSYTPLASTAAPIELETWFKRAFEPAKDKRFGSAREMMLRFEQISTTIEEDDDVDENDATQLMDAGNILATAKAALAEVAPPEDDDDDELAATAYVPPKQPLDETIDMFADRPDEDDLMPTKEISPERAAEALRALGGGMAPASARTTPFVRGFELDEVGVGEPSARAPSPTPGGSSNEPSLPAPDSLPRPPAEPSARFGSARLEREPAPPPAAPASPPLASAAPRSSDTPWAGPGSHPVPKPRSRGRGARLFFVLLLLLLAAAAAYVATQRPDLLARLRAGEDGHATEEPAAPPAEAEAPEPDEASAPSVTASASALPPVAGDQALLTVMCQPECEVRVDDQPLGPAPVFERPMAVGEHRVTLTRNGYQPKSLTVKLAKGERETLKITMNIPLRPSASAAPGKAAAP